MSTKHVTWLRAGDNGCEIKISRPPDLALCVTGGLWRHFPLVCLANAIGKGMPLRTALLMTVVYVPE